MHQILPYDHNNAIKDVVGILDVAEDAKRQQFEDHFEDKHASEDNIADLQDVCQLFRLWEETEQLIDVATTVQYSTSDIIADLPDDTFTHS